MLSLGHCWFLLKICWMWHNSLTKFDTHDMLGVMWYFTLDYGSECHSCHLYLTAEWNHGIGIHATWENESSFEVWMVDFTWWHKYTFAWYEYHTVTRILLPCLFFQEISYIWGHIDVVCYILKIWGYLDVRAQGSIIWIVMQYQSFL